jgi:carboxyl-terminal processing protease
VTERSTEQQGGGEQPASSPAVAAPVAVSAPVAPAAATGSLAATAPTPKTVWTRVAVMWAVAGAFVAGSWWGSTQEKSRQPWARERLLSTALDSVRVNFLDSLPERELLRRAVSGMLRELNDPYAALLERDGVTAYRGTLRGESQNLGLVLRLGRANVVVRRVVPGSPAALAGLRAGDEVLLVDGRRASDAWSTTRPSAGVADSAGVMSSDTVRLRIARLVGQPDTTTVALVRSAWRTPAVLEALLVAEGVGYTRLATASTGSAQELERAVEALVARGARSLVLDLRGNPGGLFDEGVQMASLFLSRGDLVASLERRGDAGHQPQYVRRTRWPGLPLVVLVDQQTASSAELVAAALRDHGRALLVGEPTYGKGLVQRVVNLTSEMSLRLTTARWLPPSGVAVTRREERGGRVTGGLAPDVYVTPAARIDVSAVPGMLSPAHARALSDAVDAVVARAMLDGWSGAPLPLLERRIRSLLGQSVAALDPEPTRQIALLGDGTRVGVRRLLEMTRGDEALWPYAAYDDPVFRAALDVIVPGLSTAAPVDSLLVRRLEADTVTASVAHGDSAALMRLAEWTASRYRGRQVLDSFPAGEPSSRPPARLEGRFRADTLVAVHFAVGPFQPAHLAGASVQLADPSGVTTPLDGRVLARLPFRAPVVAGAEPSRRGDWRHGWAYLVALRPATAAAHRGGFAGWRIVGTTVPPLAADGPRPGGAAADRTRAGR